MDPNDDRILGGRIVYLADDRMSTGGEGAVSSFVAEVARRLSEESILCD